MRQEARLVQQQTRTSLMQPFTSQTYILLTNTRPSKLQRKSVILTVQYEQKYVIQQLQAALVETITQAAKHGLSTTSPIETLPEMRIRVSLKITGIWDVTWSNL
jgi:hypothetical protein